MRILALLLAAMLFAACSAAAQTPDAPRTDALNGLFACTSIVDGGARLLCYDNATRALQRAESDGDLIAVDRAQVQALQRESFGFSLAGLANLLPQRNAEDTPQFADLQVTEVIAHGTGRHTFVMSNGQRWTQIEAQRARNVRPGDTVRVRGGVLGSFMLIPSRGGASHRVRRIS